MVPQWLALGIVGLVAFAAGFTIYYSAIHEPEPPMYQHRAYVENAVYENLEKNGRTTVEVVCPSPWHREMVIAAHFGSTTSSRLRDGTPRHISILPYSSNFHVLIEADELETLISDPYVQRILPLRMDLLNPVLDN